MKLLVAGGLTYKRARIVTGKTSAVITECRCAVAKLRHERAAKEGADVVKRRQEQLEKEVREYHERDGRQMDSGGKQPLDQLLASGAAHQRCYVRRRNRVEDDRAKVAEEEARVKELRARSRAGKKRLTRISEGAIWGWQGTMDGGRISISQLKKKRRQRLQKHKGLESGGCSVASFFSVAPLLPSLVPPPIPLAQMLRRVLVQLHRRPWWHEMQGWLRLCAPYV
jgi:hypothetical protein